MKDKTRFGYGHDKCNFCNKIKDPLVGVKVASVDKYRSSSSINRGYDKVRIILDLDLVQHGKLYNELKDRLLTK